MLLMGPFGLMLHPRSTVGVMVIVLYLAAVCGFSSALSSPLVQSYILLPGLITLAGIYLALGAVAGQGGFAVTSWLEAFDKPDRPAPAPVPAPASHDRAGGKQQPRVSRVITLNLVTFPDPKKNRIVGTTLSGERLVSVRADRHKSVDGLTLDMVEQLAVHRDDLKLILPDGRCLWRMGGSTAVASLFPGISMKSKRAAQYQISKRS
mmetsp:Transcript_9749/g.16248  ORF Transcript_9749/g.16248 Transcript_9749/m.16248 type:complete len:207 (-) Transcript_9749:269-889(-)